MSKASLNTQRIEKQQYSVQPKVKAQDPRSNQAKIPGVKHVIAVASGTDNLLSKWRWNIVHC